MKKRIRISLLIILIIAVIWGGISLFWSYRKNQQYQGFIDSIVSVADATGYDKSNYKKFGYDYNDEDGYTYAIKLPGYPSLVGNLSIAASTDYETSDALIIWVEGWFKTQYTYGVLLDEGGSEYQAYIDEHGNAINMEDKEIVSAHHDNIQLLLEKANWMWQLP